MSAIYLTLTGNEHEGYTLRATTESDKFPHSPASQSRRISPIFPVISAKPLVIRGLYIGLLCPLRAFEFIGKQPNEIKDQLWFSHGIASVIIVGKNETDILNFCQEEESDLAGWELWHIDDFDKLHVVKRHVRTVSVPRFTVDSFENISSDAAKLLDEIKIHLHEAVRCAALFMPEQLPRLERVAKAANEIASEIYFFENTKDRPTPKHFKNQTKENKHAYDVNQRLNQGFTQLIQLNSTLAYVVSQAANGAIPILERPCLVANCSLLGVGTAYRAISAIAGFVEDTFEEYPLIAEIDKHYRTYPGNPVTNNIAVYELSIWPKTEGSFIDSLLGDTKSELSCQKLTYFSSRHGFGEAHFSVTAAAQTLYAADSVRWSLVTLTHELLHSHVTGILATILSNNEKTGITPERFKEYHKSFVKYIENQEEPEHLLDSLRYIIFSFAAGRTSAIRTLHKMENDRSSSEDIEWNVPVPVVSEFGPYFLTSLHLLEEVIVHTLDLAYFYNGNIDLFIEVLWGSWTTVPAVVGDLETYSLRTLVAIATLDKSPNRTVEHRLDRALSLVRDKLNALAQKDSSNLFLQKAISYLNDPVKSLRLPLLFTPCIYLADMVSRYLCSGSVQAKFWDFDKNIESKEGKAEYLMETMNFPGGKVANPVAFLMDRAQRKQDGGFPEDVRSAWVLLATASSARF